MHKFEHFITEGKVRKSNPDLEQAKSLVNMANQSFHTLKKIDLNDQTASILLSQVYECLRQIVEALCLINGYKVYSHEAYSVYLEESGLLHESIVFDRLRRLRNGIHYYGKPVSQAVTRNAFTDVAEAMTALLKRIEEVNV